MIRIPLQEVRDNLPDLVNTVQYNNERVIIQEHERDAAAIINIEDFQVLEALIERYENELDIKETERILSEESKEDFISWKSVKSRLGLE